MIKKVIIDKANRIFQMPPDLFSFTRDSEKKTFIKKSELIDLGRFNWPVKYDTISHSDKTVFIPATTEKINQLKETIADWFSKIHNVKLNSKKEIFIGGGISSMLLNISLAFVDNGDVVFTPELGIPHYKSVITSCGGEPVNYSVSLKNNWQPEFERINTRLGRVARLLILNNPHNPTGTVLNEDNLENLIFLAGRENIAIINDAAYQSVPDRLPCSILSIAGGKKIGLELYSFSYQFGLPAMPFGFAVGNKDLISGLTMAAKLNPSFIPEFYIDMALHSIRHYPNENLKSAQKHFQNCTGAALKFIDQLNFEKHGQQSIPYLWAKIEKRKGSMTLASQLYRKHRILVVPGKAFGDSGEGFLRLSLTATSESYEKASQRVKKILRLRKRDRSK